MMMNSNRQNKNLYQARTTHLIVWLGSDVIVAILLVVSMIGCVPEATPTQAVYPTSMAHCFPESVFNSDDMRARVDCHPDDFKIEINDDTVVLFAFPDPLLDWVGPVFIIHIPSVSDVVLNTDGSIIHEIYNSSEGQNAIQGVLNNQELMVSILERAKEIESQP
jgi:hypothetical protein